MSAPRQPTRVALGFKRLKLAVFISTVSPLSSCAPQVPKVRKKGLLAMRNSLRHDWSVSFPPTTVRLLHDTRANKNIEWLN